MSVMLDIACICLGIQTKESESDVLGAGNFLEAGTGVNQPTGMHVYQKILEQTYTHRYGIPVLCIV